MINENNTEKKKLAFPHCIVICIANQGHQKSGGNFKFVIIQPANELSLLLIIAFQGLKREP